MKIRNVLALPLALGAVSLATLGTTSSTAQADADLNAFNGSECSVVSEGGDYYKEGYLRNDSTGTQKVNCPTVRERTNSYIVSASIVVDNFVEPTACTLRTRSIDGVIAIKVHTDYAYMGDVRQIRWSPGAGSITVPGNGSVYFRCDMPPQAAVYNYFVDE